MSRPPPTNESYSTERLAQQLMDSYEACGDHIFYQASKRLTSAACIGDSDMQQMRARAWAMIADKDAEIARVKTKNLELYRKISDLATDAYDLTVRAEAAEAQLAALGVTNGECQSG